MKTLKHILLPLVFLSSLVFGPRTAGSAEPVWNSFFGGGLGDYIEDIAVDPKTKDVVVVGHTMLPLLHFFPTTPGAYVSENFSGDGVFIARFSADGKTLIYSALIGGYGPTSAENIALTRSGEVIIAGITTDIDGELRDSQPDIGADERR